MMSYALKQHVKGDFGGGETSSCSTSCTILAAAWPGDLEVCVEARISFAFFFANAILFVIFSRARNRIFSIFICKPRLSVKLFGNNKKLRKPKYAELEYVISV